MTWISDFSRLRLTLVTRLPSAKSNDGENSGVSAAQAMLATAKKRLGPRREQQCPLQPAQRLPLLPSHLTGRENGVTDSGTTMTKPFHYHMAPMLCQRGEEAKAENGYSK